MATRFEIVLHGGNEASLRAAGEEALRVVEQLEAQLSLFRAGQRNRQPECPGGAGAGAGHTAGVRAAAARAEAERGKRRCVRHHRGAAGAVLGFHGRRRPICPAGGGGGSPREGGHGAGAVESRRLHGAVCARGCDARPGGDRQGLRRRARGRGAARGGGHERAGAWRHQHGAGDRTTAGRGVLEDRD